jgi:adenylosuccinate lyase
MTSYDGEEAPFTLLLRSGCKYIIGDAQALLNAIRDKAILYRYTPMNGRTHGQEAEVQSFGRRCLTWYRDIETGLSNLTKLLSNLDYSKLSGAIGTHSGIDPEVEAIALDALGLKAWMGATQIMPRILYSPVASALADIATIIDKVSTDIRLGARSGRTLWQEPFAKKQKGSSAMPHKKNTIKCENTAGMARLARTYAVALRENILTWEERDIAQSSVERVCWPDLFDVTLRAIKNLTEVMRGLVVYPDMMLIEIIESRGTYASSSAKDFLAPLVEPFGLEAEDAYRMVQVASFNVFEPAAYAVKLRQNPPTSLGESDGSLEIVRELGGCKYIGLPRIQDVLANGHLSVSPELDFDVNTVSKWNMTLHRIFDDPQTRIEWQKLFTPSHILQNEAYQFKEVFDV